MKQRYHYNVAPERLAVHIQKGYDDGLMVSSAACCQDARAAWAVIMGEEHWWCQWSTA